VQPVIELDGLTLRDFTRDDVPLVQSASATSIPDTTTVPRTDGVAEALEYIERQRGRLASGRNYAYCVARASDDVAVGYVGLNLRDVDLGRASLGYWVGPDHRGHGYAAQALAGLARWARAELQIARLELYIEPWNIASVRTAEHAGFEREGLLRSWQAVAGVRRDMWMYASIASGTAAG
jgi:ribosomal-protein-alanine N-acetyltransferase